MEFKGSLVIVSHDRHFLDRLVDHLFVFCGDGVVKDFVGNYTEYRTFIKDYEAARQKEMAGQAGHDDTRHPRPDRGSQKPRKLSYKEQQELKALEEALPRLEAEKAELEAKLSGGELDQAALLEASARYGTLQEELDAAEMRWLELTDI
jgi:ATP-binding cassette subfamily F protein uup